MPMNYSWCAAIWPARSAALFSALTLALTASHCSDETAQTGVKSADISTDTDVGNPFASDALLDVSSADSKISKKSCSKDDDCAGAM